LPDKRFNAYKVNRKLATSAISGRHDLKGNGYNKCDHTSGKHLREGIE
jgi:hypothetical protein